MTSEEKIQLMYKWSGGTTPGKQCKDCELLLSGKWHDRTYHKCEAYGLSHSEATDWKISHTACANFNGEIPNPPVYKLKNMINGKKCKEETPIPGQMSIFD